MCASSLMHHITAREVFPEFDWQPTVKIVNQLPTAFMKGHYTEFWFCTTGGCMIEYKTIQGTLYYTTATMATLLGNYSINIYWASAFQMDILYHCAMEYARIRMKRNHDGIWDADTEPFSKTRANEWEHTVARTCLLRDSLIGAVHSVLLKLTSSGDEGNENSMSKRQEIWCLTLPSIPDGYGATRDASIDPANDGFLLARRAKTTFLTQ